MFSWKPDFFLTFNQMNPYIKNPKILLLKCSIEYLYREETKFTCIDPIVLQVSKSHWLQLPIDCRGNTSYILLSSCACPHFLWLKKDLSFPQEREFLKNYVQRIVDVRPNLVLVEKTVSRIAQDMLLEHGITLVINVKPVSTVWVLFNSCISLWISQFLYITLLLTFGEPWTLEPFCIITSTWFGCDVSLNNPHITHRFHPKNCSKGPFCSGSDYVWVTFFEQYSIFGPVLIQMWWMKKLKYLCRYRPNHMTTTLFTFYC